MKTKWTFNLLNYVYLHKRSISVVQQHKICQLERPRFTGYTFLEIWKTCSSSLFANMTSAKVTVSKLNRLFKSRSMHYFMTSLWKKKFVNHTKMWWFLPRSRPHPSTKFSGNQSCRFCIILLTSKPTNRHKWKHNLFCSGYNHVENQCKQRGRALHVTR